MIITLTIIYYYIYLPSDTIDVHAVNLNVKIVLLRKQNLNTCCRSNGEWSIHECDSLAPPSGRPDPLTPVPRPALSDHGCPTRLWTFAAPHSPRRPKLNSRMKSFSLDSSDTAEQAQRRRMGSSGNGSGGGGSGSSTGLQQQMESYSNPSSSSRLQCTYVAILPAANLRLN